MHKFIDAALASNACIGTSVRSHDKEVQFMFDNLHRRLNCVSAKPEEHDSRRRSRRLLPHQEPQPRHQWLYLPTGRTG